MNNLSKWFLLLFVFFTGHATAQDIETGIREHLNMLSSPAMSGRGYVNEGRDVAARYILQKFKDCKLKPVAGDDNYVQLYDFPVNYFPGRMTLKIDGDSLKPGIDYLIDASSSSFDGTDLPIRVINLKKIKDTAGLREAFAEVDTSHAYYIDNIADACEKMQVRKEFIVSLLPMGCYLVPEENKLTWTVSRESHPATVFYVKEMPKKFKRVTVKVNATFDPANRNANIIGQVPGEVKDSFIVFSAHYDHLGMMGEKVCFPGASDNASGVGMLLSLASYFSANPQHYSILFIAFAGEEAGLMGSEFYTWHPFSPLSNIKFLINMDIMGDATYGITVVNATKHEPEYITLRQVNEQSRYLPAVKSRGEAANSDHYHFSELGVRSFFIYSSGGKGHYHDVDDRPKDVTLNNIGNVQKLLIDFVKEIH